MTLTPTPEQQKVIDAYTTGNNLIIEAGAGTGKTSTLKMLAQHNTRRRGVYIAYNRSIAQDAQRGFPQSVLCKTAHALAFAAVGRRYAHRLNSGRVPIRITTKILGITDPVKVDDIYLSPYQLARLTMEAITRFCYSSDDRIHPSHLPYFHGIQDTARRELARYLTPIAQKAWDEDITNPDGQLRFVHDHYLKIWALSRPQLPADYVLLDEAQDSNGCVAGLVNHQSAQRIWVGDRAQSIYGWRGATDAMQNAPGQRLYLSQSFRFGPRIAAEANKWLAQLDTPMQLRGYDKIPSIVAPLSAPDAVLCRSNAAAMSEVIEAIEQGTSVALVGGGQDIRRFAEAAEQLQAGQGTSHPELMAFQTWAQVQDYADQEPEGSDLRVLVRLVEKYGPRPLIHILDKLDDEQDAELIVSTAHKAKGREWDRVRIGSDFFEPKPDENGEVPALPRPELMLAYVAVTRARTVLDRGSLSWIDTHLARTGGREAS